MFKLAMIQMKVIGGKPATNLAHAEDLIDQAVDNGAQVILLPETLDVGWTHESSGTLAQPIPGGEPTQRLIAKAKQRSVYLCAGLAERDGNKVFNAAVLISPQGEILLHHRKLNEVTFALDVYDQGDRLAVTHTPLGIFGLMICADGFADGQVVSRTLGYMGADVILSPSAWAVGPDWDNEKTPYGNLWRENYSPVARDFQMWIASVSNVGQYFSARTGQIHPCIGNSLAFDAQGNEVVTGPFGEDAQTILYVDVEPTPRPTRAGGWAERWGRKPD